MAAAVSFTMLRLYRVRDDSREQVLLQGICSVLGKRRIGKPGYRTRVYRA
jgi:hypothetical protein